MEKVYDVHVHYTFDIPLKEKIEIFKDEFSQTKTEKFCFLSLPHHASKGGVLFDCCQNVSGLFLKKTFSPNAYAFAGLEHPENHLDSEKVARDFLTQAKTYLSVGFDGIKMLEGYPSLVKNWNLGVDDKVYDEFYSFMEKNGYPVLMHVANPTQNWDLKNASAQAIKDGRVYDSSYPTKSSLINQVFNVLKKFPNLKLTLAHFGFLSDDVEKAESFLSYPNTTFDLTPGGEQLINMGKNWESWLKLWQKYSDRILYGTDFYAFPKDEKWQENFLRRPNFVRQFIETNGEFDYVDGRFRGVFLDANLREKIYRENFVKLLDKPKEISTDYLKKTAEELLTRSNKEKEKDDLNYVLNNL
ncbi:MAG: amidohydrolase family protein [Clostridia bacterium]|nr:amidohydrolase family protein [Clostridia bacterium]